jgi:hypothetical protein
MNWKRKSSGAGRACGSSPQKPSGEDPARRRVLRIFWDDIEQIGPMLRKSIKEEAGLDLEALEHKIREILAHELEAE